MTPAMLKAQFPWLNTDGIAIGSFGTMDREGLRATSILSICFRLSGVQNEGWLDPWALLTAFRQKALSLGVLYLNGA